jgi:lysylphosphatidylglycerol synthetase-like protein (DUF2156 family)
VSQFLKRNIPVLIAFAIGIAMVLQYYVPSSPSQEFGEKMNIWTEIIAAFALLIGVQSLVHNHLAKIKRREVGFGYSWIVIVSMIVMTLAGLIGGGVDNPNGLYFWIFQYLEVPMQSTVFSILAFYIATAAYRAFRAKTPEATLLLIAAAIAMLGRVPVGVAITDWIPAEITLLGIKTTFLANLRIEVMTDWLLNVASVAGFRAVMFGVGLGVISTSLRIIFGIERTYLGGGD